MIKRLAVAVAAVLAMAGTVAAEPLPWKLFSEVAANAIMAQEARCSDGPVTVVIAVNGEKAWKAVYSETHVIFIYGGDEDTTADVHIGVTDPKQPDKIVIKEVLGSPDMEKRYPDPCLYLYPKKA